MSAEKHVLASVKNIEDALAKKGLRFPSKSYTPLPVDYKPELNVSTALKSDGAQNYQELIGVLHWAVEIGRVDVILEASLMSAHLALPLVEHLEAMHRMFGYLEQHPKRKLGFNAQHQCSMREYSRNIIGMIIIVEEAIPQDMPMPEAT
jgi:hypothetical protein